MGGMLEHDWFPRPVPDNVFIGERCWVYSTHAFVHCRSRRAVAVRIGDDTGIYHSTHFELGPRGSVEIGRFCSLMVTVVRTDGDVRIGDHALIAHEVVIADGPWVVPPDEADGDGDGDGGRSAPIDIGADVWIGVRATILGGARIGRGAIIGAGAVVTGDVPPGSTVAGNPARVVRAGRRE